MTAVDGAYIPGTTSGPYPARPGNSVRAFIDGPQIMRRIGEAIANARHSIWLTVAFYSDDFLLPDGQEPAGEITSGGFGPSLNGPMAMGYVRRDLAEDGTKLSLMVRGKALPATVVPLPFVPHRYVR